MAGAQSTAVPGRWLFLIPQSTSLTEMLFQKQVNGVDGLTSFTKRIGCAHINVCQSRIMQFLSLTLFFNLSGNPVEWSYVLGRIKHHHPWAEVPVTWLHSRGRKRQPSWCDRAWNFHIWHTYQREKGVSKVNYYPLLIKYREIWPKLDLEIRSKYMIID